MEHIPEELRDELESRANVVGTALGREEVGGRESGEEAVVVLVRRKVPEAQLDAADRLPETVEVEGEEVRVDVEEVGDLRPQAAIRPAEPAAPDREREWRPAPAGVSVGHPEISAGTLGTPPLRTTDGDRVVLTNAHVAAPIGAAEAGDPLLQPGPADGGTREGAIGELAEWSEIVPDEPAESDSALVSVEPDHVADRVLEIGRLVGWTTGTMDDRYTKSGRTTGVTTGRLRATDARVEVGGYYDDPVQFVGLDVFGPMSAGGDSGSVIGIEREDGFYGTDLLFAGSDRATLGIPMEIVQEVHGDLTPVAGEGDGDEDGDGGRDGGDSGSFADRVERRLRERYDRVTPAEAAGADFRVAAWPAGLVVAAAETAEEALAAVGPVVAAAGRTEVPVVIYPRSERSPDLDAVEGRVVLVPMPA